MNAKIKSLLKNSFNIYNKNDISIISTQLAFNLLFSFFPFLIVLVSLLGYSTVSQDKLMDLLRNFLPMEAVNLSKKMIVEVIQTKKIPLISFSMLAMLWSASNGVASIIMSLNRAYNIKEERSFLKLQATTFAFTIVLIMSVLIALILIVFGEIEGKVYIDMLGYSKEAEMIIDITRYVLCNILMFFMFSLLYKFAPAKKILFSHIFPGAIFSTLALIALSQGFSYYVSNLGNYSFVYGSLGSVIVFMTWLLLISNIILIGGEINAAYNRRKN